MVHSSQGLVRPKITEISIGIYPRSRVITQQKHDRAHQAAFYDVRRIDNNNEEINTCCVALF